MQLGEFVRGLKAEFWQHIDRDVDLNHITISRRELYAMMRSRPPDYIRLDKQVYYPVTTMSWGGRLPAMDNFAARWTGQLLINEPGTYTFWMKSDDGSAMNIDGHPVIGRHAHPDWDQHEWQAEPPRSRALSAGAHDLEVVYFNTYHLSGVIISYSGPDTGESLVVLPAVALRTRVAGLPPAALHDDSFLAKFGGEERDRWCVAASLRRPDTWLAACLAFGAAYGVVVLGAKWRRRRRSVAGGSLRRILALRAEELEPCCS